MKIGRPTKDHSIDWKAEKDNLCRMVLIEKLSDQEIAAIFNTTFRNARNARLRHVGQKKRGGRPQTRKEPPLAPYDAIIYRPRVLTKKEPNWSFWEHNL